MHSKHVCSHLSALAASSAGQMERSAKASIAASLLPSAMKGARMLSSQRLRHKRPGAALTHSGQG
jgi:hypothetical protein